MATNKVSNEQLEELLEFLTEHPTLVKGVGLGARSKETSDKLWNDLAMKLNSFGSGSSKSGERWKKYWADLKHKTKSRLAKRRQDSQATGGGPSSQEDLTDYDKKVLAIIGEQSVYGDTQYRVPIFNSQPSPPPSSMPASASVEIDNIGPSEEIVILDPIEYTEQCTERDLLETQASEPPQRVENPVNQPIRKRPRLRQRSPTSATRIRSRLEPEWVMELEKNRVAAENKIADGITLMAQATKTLAEASLVIAETSRMNAETSRMNAETSRMNAETSRMQIEVMKTAVEIIGQLSSVLGAKDSN